MSDHSDFRPADDPHSLYFQPNVGGVVSKVSMRARKKMFERLMKLANPTAETRILDVGVTSDPREDCNFFEKLYPYPHHITAVGLEDASFLERDFPGLTFIKTDGLQLPFPDQSFDLVLSFAVIEHVGSRERQRMFVHEMCRVGRQCCITTPNRWYPLEFHTILPLVHWLPAPWFRSVLKLAGKDFFAAEENLNLLSARDLAALFPKGLNLTEAHHRLFGPVSNLLFFAQPEP